MTETPREIRENLIIQWYEKKLNRDELLKVLEGSEILNSEKKKEIESEIIKNFYENYEKAKESEEFKEADEMYRKIKKTKRDIIKKERELTEKRKSSEKILQEIDDQMLEIAEVAMSLEDGSFLKKLKLKKTNEKRDELQKQQDQIKGEIRKIYFEKESIISDLKEKEKNYGPKIGRPKIKGKNLDTLTKSNEELKKQTTLKGYKEKYFQIIKEKEDFIQNFLAEIENIDLGISEEKKNEVIKLLKIAMEKELESMKSGDEITKLADETEKWLEDNWKTSMEQLVELSSKMKEIKIQINEIEAKEKTASTEELLEIKEKEFAIKKELLDIKNKYESIKNEVEETLKQYNGTSIDWSKFIHIETWQEKGEREKKEQELESTSKKHKPELDEFISQQKKSWTVKYHKYPHGRCDLYEEDRAAVECKDKSILIALFDCESDVDSTDSDIDPEQSKILCINFGNQKVYKKFVYIDAHDSNNVDKSKAYTHIDLVDIQGDKLVIKLSSDVGQDLYTFHIEDDKLGKGVFEGHNQNILEGVQNDTEYFEVPENLKELRDEWKEGIERVTKNKGKWGNESDSDYLSDKHREKIIKEIDKIPVNVKIDEDGSRLIEFKLGDKTYKILDPKLDNHTDEDYRHIDYYIKEELRDNGEVNYSGMLGDNVDEWKNLKLKEYVKRKQSEGLHLATEKEMKTLFQELGKYLNVRDEADKMAAFMYLTGMDGWYFLSREDGRSYMCCAPGRRRIFECNKNSSGKICMISCEKLIKD